MTGNWIEMKGGMRANGLIAPKTAGTAARINGIGAKTEGIAEKMFANSKEIDGSTEGMYPAMEEGPVFAKASTLKARRRQELFRGTPDDVKTISLSFKNGSLYSRLPFILTGTFCNFEEKNI